MVDLIQKIGRLGKKAHLYRVPGSKKIYQSLKQKQRTRRIKKWVADSEYEIRELEAGDYNLFDGYSIENYTLCLPPKYYDRWSQTDSSEGDEIEAIFEFVNEGDTVADIGGHLGRSLIPFHKAVGESGQVIVFEPIPPWAYYLNRTVKENELANVDIENAALATKSGTTKISIPDEETSQSSILTPDDIPENKYTKGVSLSVDSIELSDYLDDCGISQLDFAKIDIEGGEYRLICASDTLDFFDMALVELHFDKMGVEKSNEVIGELASRGELKTISANDLTERELRSQVIELERTHVLWCSE